MHADLPTSGDVVDLDLGTPKEEKPAFATTLATHPSPEPPRSE